MTINARFRFTLLLVVCALSLSATGALAQNTDDFQKAMAMYAQKSYDAAIPFFTNAAQKGNVRATYYLALCYQNLKQDAKALELFRHISKNFKGSPEAAMCDSYLARAPQAETPAPAKPAATSPIEALKQKIEQLSEAQWKALPQSARIPFQMRNGHMHVQAKVNGQYVDIIFDTGASMCCISRADFPNLFSAAELAKAPVVPVGRPHGVDLMRVCKGEVSVDRITRDCTVFVTNEPGVSLIGQNFFKEYTYEIDGFYVRMTKAPYTSPIAVAEAEATNSEKLVKAVEKPDPLKRVSKTAQKTDANASPPKSTDKYKVPFVREHNCMIVEMMVNGRPVKTTFDTGCAPDGLVMPMSFVSPLGIQRNSDGYFAEKAEIGPITRKYAQVNFANGLDCILIGPKFFGDRPYTVDPVNNVIKFQY